MATPTGLSESSNIPSALPNGSGREAVPKGWLLAGLLLVIVFLTFDYPVVNGKAAPLWDASAFFAPAFTLVADTARTGHFVLWNPWESAGSPDCAEPELGTISPIQIAVGLVTGGTEGGFRAY